MAELELNVLQLQCLDRRLGDRTTMGREVAVRVGVRNAAPAKITWHVTTADARIKIKRLEPVLQECRSTSHTTWRTPLRPGVGVTIEPRQSLTTTPR